MGFWSELAAGRGSHISILERYTEAARRAVALSKREAMHRGEVVVTAADLLAGLMEEENTRAVRAGSLKANASYLRWLLGLPPLPMRLVEATAEESRLELDAEARRALAYAVAEADRDREYWIDTDHLLRGLLRFPNFADFAVLKTEMNLHKLRVASRVDRGQFPPDQAPNRKLVEYRVRKYVELLAPPVISLVCYLYILIQGLGLAVLPQTR